MAPTGINNSRNREHVLATAGDLQGVYEEQVGRAGRLYRLESAYVDGSGAYHDVDADNDDRIDLANDTFEELANESLYSLVDPDEEFNTKDKSRKAQVRISDRIEGNGNALVDGSVYGGSDYYDPQGIEDLAQEAVVKSLAESGDLYNKGGPIGNWTGSLDDLSDGVDGAFLAERSKQTGEKFF